MISEIASEEVYKAFMTRGFTREAMKDRKVNLGLDLFLNLKGSHYWSTPEETRVAEEYRKCYRQAENNRHFVKFCAARAGGDYVKHLK